VFKELAVYLFPENNWYSIPFIPLKCHGHSIIIAVAIVCEFGSILLRFLQHCRGCGVIAVQSVLDFCWIKWNWERCSVYFNVPVSVVVPPMQHIHSFTILVCCIPPPQ